MWEQFEHCEGRWNWRCREEKKSLLWVDSLDAWGHGKVLSILCQGLHLCWDRGRVNVSDSHYHWRWWGAVLGSCLWSQRGPGAVLNWSCCLLQWAGLASDHWQNSRDQGLCLTWEPQWNWPQDESMGMWPSLSLAAALGRVSPIPCLDNRVELTLQEWVQVNLHRTWERKSWSCLLVMAALSGLASVVLEGSAWWCG